MKSLYLSLAVDDNFSPLNVNKQLAIAFAKGAGKEKVIKAEVIGWPFLLVRDDVGGYYIFDETRRLFTKIDNYVIQDYDKLLSSIDKMSSDEEILNYLNGIRWDEFRGVTSITLGGLVSDDLKDVFKLTPSSLNIKTLPKTLSDIDVELALADIAKLKQQLTQNMAMIEKVEEKIGIEINIIKGKRSEEKKRIEDKYDSEINSKETELKQKLNDAKKNLETELKTEASKLYSKLADIEVVIGKAELEKEAGFLDSVNSANMIKTQYLSEINNKLNIIKDKYKPDLKNMRSEINTLLLNKKNDIDKIDNEIKSLEQQRQEIISKLEKVKNYQNNILLYVESLAKKIPYADEKLEIIVPLVIVYTAQGKIVVPPQVYKGSKKSFLGIFKKDPSEISAPVNGGEVLIRLLNDSGEPLDKYKQQINQGLNELYEEGYNVKKNYDEYF
ncbi:hypothetical protein DFR86_01425 [Acidianus sulfidivorans JP7]|uniref:Uncharacterized protein n=1 Tax=Acidianus sulfidivorans JP7 TaxID=619593 RepID=A0A2U9IK41_9CREN|nr:hypothetical protein [Acidianus sulfidivorans]AWR96336.1 hypothetical protein DFR86_01425 [Acidianus sulfidivorans JP7]